MRQFPDPVGRPATNGRSFATYPTTGPAGQTPLHQQVISETLQQNVNRRHRTDRHGRRADPNRAKDQARHQHLRRTEVPAPGSPQRHEPLNDRRIQQLRRRVRVLEQEREILKLDFRGSAGRGHRRLRGAGEFRVDGRQRCLCPKVVPDEVAA